MPIVIGQPTEQGIHSTDDVNWSGKHKFLSDVDFSLANVTPEWLTVADFEAAIAGIGGGGLTLPIQESDVDNLPTDLAALGASITSLQGGKQASNALLSDIAATGIGNDQLLYGVGTNDVALTGLTAAGRAILDDAAASDQRATLGLVIGTDVASFNDGRFTQVQEVSVTGDYHPILTDAGKCLKVFATGGGTAAVTITIDPNSTTSFPIGTVFSIYRNGTGSVTIAAGAGVTIRSPAGDAPRTISDQHGEVTCRKRLTDTWVLEGSLA